MSTASAHAKLSPSGAERWMTCPGSTVLSEGIPDRTSKYADEGTAAHDLAEQILSGKHVIASETVAALTPYINHVRALGGKLHVEQKVAVNHLVYGTADAIVWQEEEQHLHVIDLKYGAGVAVDVVDNLQLKIYALATLITFNYPAKSVTSTIVQPRYDHSDGPVRSVTFDAVDLLDFHGDIVAATAVYEDVRAHDVATLLQSGYLVASEKGCRWCRAAPVCPLLKQKAQSTAKKVFASGEPYDPKELAETLDFLPILESWIKNTREFAYEQALIGKPIPDWKLVEKRAVRKWRDETAVCDALIAQNIVITDEFFTERKMQSPAAVEKLLPKDMRGVLDALVAKESSGHTLVHASDKRPAVDTSAASAFANV